MEFTKCYHCGDPCRGYSTFYDNKNFCCSGCKAVYEMFQSNDLSYYYDLEENAGTSPTITKGKYDFLDNPEILASLLEFEDGGLQVISFYIPSIHCSSCIWVLENLKKLMAGVVESQVDFPKKTIRVSINTEITSVKKLVYLLTKIGYEPYISLEDLDAKESKTDRTILYKLGIAGFAFGNIMFLSFPEYFEVNEYWLEQYKVLFRWLMFSFSIPVVFYAGNEYLSSAYKGLRSGILNIDVPIALGILVIFLRSTYDIATDQGSGFFDSLAGLVFFLLIGRYFQQKTYSFLSFERDYKSYFPIAVTRLDSKGREENVQVYDIKAGDYLLIRNEELIPVDGVLQKGDGLIDYSFVTGESQPIVKKAGEKLYAGGRQCHGALEVEALKSVSQSYLTQLWSNAIFKKNKKLQFQTLTDSIGKRFTIAVLTIAVLATSYWLFIDSSRALNVFTAVLIIACPCAIALAAPFTLGNMLRIFGKKKFFLKDSSVIEQLAQVNTAIFDKTGTITSTGIDSISYNGLQLNKEEESLIKNTLRATNHPLGRSLYVLLKGQNIYTLDEYEEHVGKGVKGEKDGRVVKIGSADFVGFKEEKNLINTTVHISANNDYKGCFVFSNTYRDGLSDLFRALQKSLDIAILSGDNASEKSRLQKLLPKLIPLYFNQKPADKLNFIKELQENGKNVLMVGDGLNDAGALAQSNVGIAISENTNVFSPACDGILDASRLKDLHGFISASRKAIQIIKMCFVFSLLYNVVGLYFAVTGQLEPVIAAILMPLSSISIVSFATLASNRIGKRINPKN
ncbi:heavy metal translocating P-type ATPase [Eudoraea chungangensis]|uniref:heavy metal translocating P-type ATPase n=1 Tax=Eudoraea chungangensis TaxID=1481905 RepID=UPI0023EDC39A|nr:heavy metal translocating P-type ATPase metal-binding domain-containing protein [Eudoraea chungangensis]